MEFHEKWLWIDPCISGDPKNSEKRLPWNVHSLSTPRRRDSDNSLGGRLKHHHLSIRCMNLPQQIALKCCSFAILHTEISAAFLEHLLTLPYTDAETLQLYPTLNQPGSTRRIAIKVVPNWARSWATRGDKWWEPSAYHGLHHAILICAPP